MSCRHLSAPILLRVVSLPVVAVALLSLLPPVAGCGKEATAPKGAPSAGAESVKPPAKPAGEAPHEGAGQVPSEPPAKGKAGAEVGEEAAPARSGAAHPKKLNTDKLNDPKTCGRCHRAIYKEWTESMHARAHHSRDPIYAGMRAARVAKEGDAVAGRCAQCHTPRDTDPASDSPLALQGVGCLGCHSVQAVHLADGKKGAKAFVWGPPGRMFGPHDLEPGRSKMHATGPAPAHMRADAGRANDLCLACHGDMTNAKGVPMCATGVEHAAMTGDVKRCVDCHMPRAEGKGAPGSKRSNHASHKFLGPHRAWYQGDSSLLAKAVGVETAWDGGALRVTLRNLTGHAFPTGFPGRVVLLKGVGFDKSGAKVWENFTDDPMKQSPASVLNQAFTGEGGQPTLPPFSVKRVRDTRIPGGGVKEVRFDLPKVVVKVELRLIMRLVPPPVVGKFKLDPTQEGSPKVFFKRIVTRP